MKHSSKFSRNTGRTHLEQTVNEGTEYTTAPKNNQPADNEKHYQDGRKPPCLPFPDKENEFTKDSRGSIIVFHTNSYVLTELKYET